ncbi:MAG: S8 family serine peptidase, partial [candidate division Zixibacteria bacterium]
MKNLLAVLVLGFLMGYLGAPALAGQYSPDFDLYLEDHQSEEMIGAVITMADQVDLGALKQELSARRADRREWHETVVLALQDNATANQADIISQLADLANQGLVRDYQGMWIGNVVLVTATPEALDILVQRDDILQINPDYEIENIEPVSRSDDDPSLIASVENGLRAIRADEVWAMGYTGAGRLVSHLDTGVDGNHPALGDRWRGRDPRYANNPEWAWFDSISHTQFPQDWGSHGTHTMGTICGLGESTGDTIGVAFGAEWISAGVIDRQSIPRTVGDAIGAFQWIADPDGDPGTVWDVPDACSNSWGLTTGHGYPHCDEVFWVVLDGCEAAGVFVVFAAGNEGSGPRSLRNPATRASTDIQSFAIGALDGNNPNLPIAGFSSRGPTECTPDGRDTIKPEVSAPGVNVRSSVPGGGYAGGWSGTSMACPHVAGVVALMREANPNLTTDQIGEIMMETAFDLGQEGEDNAYGWGIVDAYEAVIRSLAYLEGWGTLAGYITDQATGNPIQGATVSVIDRDWSATSNGAGF